MRTLTLAVTCALAVCLSACSCPGTGGMDSGVDAGPTPCSTTTDCAAVGMNYVCDPQDGICVARCTDDMSCSRIPDGVCEASDGTCRPPCGPPNTDYCPALDAGLTCLPSTGHCVPKCVRDDDCTAINPGSHCDEPTGNCVISGTQPCTIDTQCNSSVDFEDYCFFQGVQCRCSIENGPHKDAGWVGVCHRRHRACDECVSDTECGNQSYFEPMGACKTVPGDTSGKKYCLQQPNPSCACGYLVTPIDNSAYCAPQTGFSCAMPGCGADEDCASGSVCNTIGRCVCEPRCRWDFGTKGIAPPGCPTGQTCWVDNENLDPTSIYYGAGRCKPPCSTDMDCQSLTVNPHGGPKLKCAAEDLGGGMQARKRCRSISNCMDDLECPPQPDTSNYYGYCDRGQFDGGNACKLDCRTGDDPVNMKPYDDCRSPYGCVADAGGNVCVLKTCAQQGGASIACNEGEYCCGEDKNNDGMVDPCPTTGLQPNKCYRLPIPPFCQGCMEDADCKNLGVPSYMMGTGACTNGSKAPSCSPLPFTCIAVGMAQICGVPTFNDPRRDSSGRGADSKGCPANFAAEYVRVVANPMAAPNWCATTDDCNKGTDAGSCEEDTGITLMDGSHPKVCKCTVGAATPDCPNTPDGGIVSQCAYGNPGDRRNCISSVVCKPRAGFISDPMGCGL